MKGDILDCIGAQNADDAALQTARVVDELFKTSSRHPDFFRCVLWCLQKLINSDPFNEDCQDVVRSAVDRLAETYATTTLWTQLQVVNELRKFNEPELTVLLGNAFRRKKYDATLPLRFLLPDVVPNASESEQLLPSYAMAVGENSSFTLGLAADGPVREARKVSLEGVKKVSMSNSHTLFLTQKGEVYACGQASNFDTGEDNGSLIVNPIKIEFRGESLPIVDLAAGPNHSIFITSKSVYVCGLNRNFCIGQRNENCQYSMKKMKLPTHESIKKVLFYKVFTNADCTIVFSSFQSETDMWIVGKTPCKTYETFTRIEREVGVFEIIRSNNNVLSMSSELVNVVMIAIPIVLPVCVVTLSYKRRSPRKIEVTISNTAGVLNFAFDPSSGRLPFEPCIISINGVLVDFFCTDYFITKQGDVFLMGSPENCREGGFTLYRGKAVVIGDRVEEDGFTSAYARQSDISALRLLLLLQEVPGGHVVSSFACSPDGKNLIYVTNSSTCYRCEQWEAADYEKLNEEREHACLDRIELDFHIYETDGQCMSTFGSIIRSRFPNIDKFRRSEDSVWIEDLSREVTGCKSSEIFHGYLVFNENRVLNNGISKTAVENVCRVLGVPLITSSGFYQIGEPLTRLEEFYAERDCILISEEDVEIEFVQEILKMQSTYFGVAFSYQRGDDLPRLKLAASEGVIRYTLLSIINPSYLRRLQIHEFLELLPFLDQYLLHAVIADALRVIFERVNEFNMGFLFELYETVPQLRVLIAEYFSCSPHLLSVWKNAANAPLELVRSVFAWDRSEENSESCAPTESAVVKGVPFSVTTRIHTLSISEPSHEENKRASWHHFRTDDVIDLLLGGDAEDPSSVQALLEYLNNDAITMQGGYRLQGYPRKVPEPDLVKGIRSRLLEREQSKAAKRSRKKSTRLHGLVETSLPAVKQNFQDQDISWSEEVPNCEQKLQGEVSSIAVDSDLSKEEDTPPLSEVAVEKSASATCLSQSAWKVADIPSPPPLSSLVSIEASASSSKKRLQGRFTPKGAKFRDASNLLSEEQEQGTHFAPWAKTASPVSESAGPSLCDILREESENAKKSSRGSASSSTKAEGIPRRRTSGSMSWSESAPSSTVVASPLKPSLAEIIKEEEHRLLEGTRRLSRPLHFIEDEERAIEELTQLYRDNVGDEVIVSVERCAVSSYPPLWANTPHFRL